MLPADDVIAKINEARRTLGFLEIEAVLGLAERGNIVLDPFSTLIARPVRIGAQNVFYPGVTLLCAAPDALSIGDGNTFHSGERRLPDGRRQGAVLLSPAVCERLTDPPRMDPQRQRPPAPQSSAR
jgi:hypothetical protein